MSFARWHLEAALVVALAVAVGMYGCEQRHAGRAEMLRDAALDSAKVNAERLAATRAHLAAAVARAGAEVARADTAAAVAHAVGEQLARVTVQRDAARRELIAARSPGDSIAALVRKSAADDSVIAEQQRLIDAGKREAAALRESVATLYAAADSAAAQIARDAATEAQLGSALTEAQPPSGLRVWGERVLWLAAGYGLGRAAP